MAYVGTGPHAIDDFDDPIRLRTLGLSLRVCVEPFGRAIRATLLVGPGGPLLMLNAALGGTLDETASCDWAVSVLTSGVPGLYVLVAAASA